MLEVGDLVVVEWRGESVTKTGVPYNKRKAKPATPEISNNDYAANFNDFLEAAPKDKKALQPIEPVPA